MARTVVVGNETFKQRNILGVWLGLPLITLGIYSLVWYFKINNEARRYLRDESIHPWVSLLAVTLGAVLIIPPFYSTYKTCSRIRRMEEHAGVSGHIEPVLGVVLIFVFGLDTMYMQAHLNGIWARYLLAAPATRAPLPAPAPAALASPTPPQPLPVSTAPEAVIPAQPVAEPPQLTT